MVNNLNNILFESLTIGLITLIIGKIVLELFNPNNPFKQYNKYGLPYATPNENKDKRKICIVLFITGFLIHIINEYFNINCFFFSKQCVKNISHFTK
jgi:hypothetical protein